MRRRRLIMVAGAVALVTAGGAWWLMDDALSAEEQRLVGTWRTSQQSSGLGASAVMSFNADRQARIWIKGSPWPPAATPYRWQVRNGMLVIDYEPNLLRRTLRSAASLLGVQAPATDRSFLEWETDDEVGVVETTGDRGTLVRVLYD